MVLLLVKIVVSHFKLNRFKFFLALLIAGWGLPQSNMIAAEFVGEKKCRECHQQQSETWTGSHHDLAMQPVSSKTVLGDFDNARFEHNGLETLFYQKQDDYYIKTDGPDGEINEYRIKYVFGVEPLQQYLIELDGGRIQAFSIVWDSRDKSVGGQRWFHIYPDESVTYNDELHWTAPSQNWNNMCASCHSTNLKKNFDLQKKRYDTSYSEVNVSCEACHGPGSDHLNWAKKSDQTDTDNYGLLVNLNNSGHWNFEKDQPIAKLTESADSGSQVESCARCHSRRSELWPDYEHGKVLLDTHLPSLLDSGLYYPDGQINDEVYVYGSFLQSKMYRQGVTCSNCHDPHSLKLKAKGNALCSQCHSAKVYDVKEHHFHKMSTTGAECVSCHMMEKKFMVIDDRADHSFRAPRPDLSIKTGSPNACTGCHDDQSDEWAQAKLEKWYGKKINVEDSPHYGEVFYAAENGAIDAEKWLNYLAQDGRETPIVRATAVSQILANLSPITTPALLRALRDDDPLIKLAAVPALERLPPAEMREYADKFLDDELRIIRMEAARVLAGSRYLLQESTKILLDSALEEYKASLLANADRAESHVNLGNLYLRKDDFQNAEQAYLQSIQINPHFIPAYINLADLYRTTDNDAKGLQIINHGLDQHPRSDMLHHAKGLLYVRQKNISKALLSLEQAVELEPENIRYKYVYAIALYSNSNPDQALLILEKAHQDSPSDRQILNSLISIYSELGNVELARVYAQKLYKLSPWDTSIKQFLEQTN